MASQSVKKANGKHYTNNNSSSGISQAERDRQWDDVLPFPALTPVVARAVVFVAAVICFINSHDGDFVFDDSEAIVGNKDLLPETPLTNLLHHDFWGQKLTNKSHKSYRPLTILTYRWNYQLAGGLSPWGFHVVNIILHGVVSVLFLSFFMVLLSSRPSSHVSKSAFLCSLLFAVHPIHSESVAGLVGRADLLCALFFLLSFLSYVRACSGGDAVRVCRPERVSWWWLGLTVLLCFLATFSKEQGITVIGVCCAYDIISGFPLWLQSLFQRLFVLIISAVALLLLRLQATGLSPPTFQVVDNPHSFVNGSIYRALNYNYLYAINGWLLVNPWWLSFDWSMGCVPVITSVADPRLVAAVVFWFVIGCLVFHCLQGELNHEKRCLAMGLAALVIPFLPASNLLIRVGFVIAERNLYLPSAGFCVLVTLGSVRLSSNASLKQVVRIGLGLLLAVYVARSIQRSDQWRKELPLYTDAEKVCPLNGKVHYNIAKLNGDQGNVEYAIEKYKLAIQLHPKYDQAMNNLANILKDNGDNLEAEELLTKAVTINPEFAAAWMNLGIVKANLKKYEEGEKCYRNALRHRRKYPDCYYNLGNLYLDQQRHQDALDAWHNATRLKPDHLNSWSNAIILLDNLGRYEQAVKMGEVALKYLPDSAALWFNLGNVHGKMEHWEESERVLYHRWGKLDAAEKAYKKVLEISPKNPSALENLQMLQRKRETQN
ncbi:hypothetical protein BaRGS_00032757 [Batillaria attramentaria]|uniref:dolichyl-phosphate-mannose--protein mannosyltransferase n=1 Tax=Batillaria attramentaria TaxID=370345 RepID=A0ABD0JMU3_9CAEN